MNHSLRTADRSTYLRVVTVALAAAIATTSLAIVSRWEPEMEDQATITFTTDLPMATSPVDVMW